MNQEVNMKYVIIGGVAAGASAAARLRRLDEASPPHANPPRPRPPR